MSEKNISEELWMRFLERNVSEEENDLLMRLIAEDDELLQEYLAVNESLKRIDSEPLTSPDLDFAQKRIGETLGASSDEEDKMVLLPRRSNVRKYLALAAVAALLVGVALFLLLRSNHNENNFAQQEDNRIETKAEIQSTSPETTVQTEQTDKTGNNNDNLPKNNTEGIQQESTDSQQETFATQEIKKNYATTQEANTLTVIKPNKDNYCVLCKNLEKTLNFEWSVTNVETLHFVVKDSKGKTVAETQDVTANQYFLKYSNIYPEKRLVWVLTVVFKDGLQEKRSGEIHIDYNF